MEAMYDINNTQVQKPSATEQAILNTMTPTVSYVQTYCYPNTPFCDISLECNSYGLITDYISLITRTVCVIGTVPDILIISALICPHVLYVYL